MATPRAVKAAMVLSVATTGGAMYYFLSEGGDPAKLDHNIANATEKLNQIGAKVSETSAKLAETTSTLKDTVSSWSAASGQVEQHLTIAQSAQSTENPAKLQADAKDKEVSTEDLSASAETRSRDYPSNSTKCYTCSGPRIWFFAEKLRLKRRITPYPDPPEQSPQ